ncbi:MarR family winged helix-turn-helix transcriptional regulator [Thalassospira marina]|uniref:MarR family transcriptional regulator n=1 Tax=Thalassospira marina TaxID=2048283 RepID=A0ABN5FPI8_9PROT|nr:MarR family transcriptional regulator [Thalassospira marina]AUG53454.1 MarR family transcriptional regulator [Thalassospira marina]
MTSKNDSPPHDTLGAWTKRCYFAGRAAMEAMLRPFDLGSTQWYILHQLAHHGPTIQRDLGQLLQIERSTLTVIVGALVRKGLVEQVPDEADQRRKLLRLTPSGNALWDELPDLSIIATTAFGNINDAEKDAAVRVLRHATEQLNAFIAKGCKP